MKRFTSKRTSILVGLTLAVLVVLSIVIWHRFAFSDGNATGRTLLGPDNSIDGPTRPASVGHNKSQSKPDAPIEVARLPQRHERSALGALPPEGTQWSEVFSALMDRARHGDKDASDRLYDDTIGCTQYINVLQSARELLRAELDTSNMSPAQIARELDGYTTIQSILGDNIATCSNVTQEQLLAQMYPILENAAKNGNERAAACYASGAFGPPHGTALEGWTKNALDFMHAGVRRGDWRMVSLLQSYLDPITQTFATSYSPMWEARQFQTDPEAAYRYASLWAIGASTNGTLDDRARSNQMLLEFRQRNALSNAQIADAELWAQQMYQQYFDGKPWNLGGDSISWCNHGK